MLRVFPIALVLTHVVLNAQQPMQWEENPQIGVEINGKIDISSQVFQPTSYRPYMILTSAALPVPVLIDLTKRSVSRLKGSDVTVNEYFAHTNGIPNGRASGNYTMKDGASTFKVAGKTVSITVRQTLVGEVSASMILAHSPDYRIRKNNYRPKRQAMDFLKSYRQKTDVIVVFATWCATCKELLPKVMRIFDDAANPAFTMKYIGIAMGGNEPRTAIEKYGHDYPAVIFYRNGREIDRIIADPPGALEDLIVTILK